VDLRQVGKRSLECLIRVGALDSFGSRKSLLMALDRILSVSTSHFRAAQSGQLSFFGTIAGVEEDIVLPPSSGLDQREYLEWERELIGLYVSDHPLSPYLPTLSKRVSHYAGQLGDVGPKDKVSVAGLVTKFRHYQTKDGKPMGFATLEDIQGNIELVIFPKTWEKYSRLVEMDNVLLAEGKVDAAQGDPKVLVDKLTLITSEDMLAAEPDTPTPPVATFTAGAVQTAARGVAEAAPTWNENFPPPPDDDWFMGELPPEPEWDDLPMPYTPTARAAQSPPIQPVAAAQPSAPPPPAPQEAPAPNEIKNEPPEPALAQSFPAPEPRPAFVPVNYIIPPAGAREESSKEPRMVTVVLRSSGDKTRDVRRMKRVHGLLVSQPGHDRFAFHVFENGHRFLLEFPNDTTGISADLIRKLVELVGEENVRVETIKLQ
jgi:DNA polymerase-3 subunit alpha